MRTETELRASIELAHVHLATIESQRLAIADISAPIIDVWEGVIVLPIVGQVDSQRSIVLTERLLTRISVSGARSVIVDLTGVEMVDTMTANHLLKTLAGARLLGAFCLLSGNEGPQLVTIGEHTVVAHQVKTRWRNEGCKAGEEGVSGDVGESGALASRLLEVNPKCAGINRQEGKDERASH